MSTLYLNLVCQCSLCFDILCEYVEHVHSFGPHAHIIQSINVKQYLVHCNCVYLQINPWLTSLGYSLCYGTILVKTVRIWFIFNKPQVPSVTSSVSKHAVKHDKPFFTSVHYKHMRLGSTPNACAYNAQMQRRV